MWSPPPSSAIKLLNTLVLELAQVIIDTMLYRKQLTPIIKESHLQGGPMWLP